ncbi:hypothetical protein GA0070558_10878 [Micromonospora haikouensis]|uniref:Uncharacterized protein n=1 Tax=Micromonospora haikouensis TaxID=686309 RepID=A0A1C4VCQ6_9ACTN|nr:hypothetical protein GA0070558_10878 [Micromonospora haikouensis]
MSPTWRNASDARNTSEASDARNPGDASDGRNTSDASYARSRKRARARATVVTRAQPERIRDVTCGSSPRRTRR